MKQIIAENKGRVKAIIRKFTKSDNEDIEQEVYIKAWQNMDKYQEEGKFGAWIGAIAANVCRDYFKTKQYKAEQKNVSDPDVMENIGVDAKQEKELSAKQRQKVILKAINQLSPDMKKVVVLYEFENLNYEEIAKITNASLGTVKSRMFNARKILSEKLDFLKGDRDD